MLESQSHSTSSYHSSSANESIEAVFPQTTARSGSVRTRQIRQWSEEDYLQIIESHKQGLSLAQTALRIGMPLSTAKRIRRYYQLNHKHIRPKPRGGSVRTNLISKTSLHEFCKTHMDEILSLCDGVADIRVSKLMPLLVANFEYGQIPTFQTTAGFLNGKIMIFPPNAIEPSLKVNIDGESSLSVAEMRLGFWSRGRCAPSRRLLLAVDQAGQIICGSLTSNQETSLNCMCSDCYSDYVVFSAFASKQLYKRNVALHSGSQVHTIDLSPSNIISLSISPSRFPSSNPASQSSSTPSLSDSIRKNNIAVNLLEEWTELIYDQTSHLSESELEMIEEYIRSLITK